MTGTPASHFHAASVAEALHDQAVLLTHLSTPPRMLCPSTTINTRLLLCPEGCLSWAHNGSNGPDLLQDLLQDWLCPPHAGSLHSPLPLLPSLQGPPDCLRRQGLVQGQQPFLFLPCKLQAARCSFHMFAACVHLSLQAAAPAYVASQCLLSLVLQP